MQSLQIPTEPVGFSTISLKAPRGLPQNEQLLFFGPLGI
jgi:hypothetical protein